MQQMAQNESIRESQVHITRKENDKEKQNLHSTSQIITDTKSSAYQCIPPPPNLPHSSSVATNHTIQTKFKELQNRKKDFSCMGCPPDSSPMTPGPPPRLTNRTPSKETPKGILEDMDWEDDSCQTPDTEHSSIETEHSTPESSLHQDSDDDSIESFPDYGSGDSRSSRDTSDTPPSIELSSGASPIFRSFSMGQESHRSLRGSFELPKLTFETGVGSRYQRHEKDLEFQHSAHSFSTSDHRETNKIMLPQRSASSGSRNSISCIYSDAAVSGQKLRLENSSPTRQLDSLLRKAKMTFAALRKEIEIESSH